MPGKRLAIQISLMPMNRMLTVLHKVGKTAPIALKYQNIFVTSCLQYRPCVLGGTEYYAS